MFGFLNIDKPAGMTSHDVVAKVRRAYREHTGEKLKIGHAGTLDPMATGVLILCLGGATRLSDFVMHTTKGYRAQVLLGVSTDTYDADGEVVERRDASAATSAQAEAVLAQFRGEIAQVPPMYSAIKQGGRKLYDLARAGQTVEREPRHVTIESLTLDNWVSEDPQHPAFDLSVRCSAGTYIRSLAYDIGEALGVGAHLTGLRRTASGVFDVGDAVALDVLLAKSDWYPYLISPQDALYDWPMIQLDAEALDHIAHGRSIPMQGATVINARPVQGDPSLALALGPDGLFVALVEARDSVWRPYKVFLNG